jgi:pimeloyl-ACP methyl ester carboxylesterase
MNMKTLKAITLFLPFFLMASSHDPVFAQKKVGTLTFEIVRPTAANGQEIIYKDKSNREVKVEFGTLVVPERHDKPNGNTIELAFFRLKSASPNPGSPIVFLEGGPGLPGTNAYYGPNMELFIPLLEISDVIILDQRGTGHTKPRMRCPNAGALLVSDQLATYEAMLNDTRE